MRRYATNSVTAHSKTVRLDIQLSKPDDSSYNSISYAKLVNLELGKDIASSDLLGLAAEDTYDRFKDYEEESYIDNTEVYRDSLPAGKEPELGGFYVNTGKLKLKSIVAAESSVDKNKKEGKKKIYKKTKAVKTKNIRKKESILPKVKKSKHENTKISVNRKMHNNIRLDALLKTVGKQKKKGFVKSINMQNTSKHSSATDASEKVKKSFNITPKKKVLSANKFSGETSEVSTKMFLNETEVTIPREDFLSSKTGSFNARDSTSDSDEIKIVKEIIHSVKINNNEDSIAQNSLNLKTATTSESAQVVAKALLSPLKFIPMDLPYLPLDSLTFDLPSQIYDSEKASSTLFQAAVPKKLHRSSSDVAVEPDFITFNPSLKAAKPLNLPKAIIAKNPNSSRKVVTDSILPSNSSLLDTVVRSNSSKAINACACSNSSKTVRVLKRSRSFKEIVKPVLSGSSKGTVKSVRSSSSKSTDPEEKYHSPYKSAAEYALFQDGSPLKESKSKSTKATIKPTISSSSYANFSPFRSSSSKATISKEASYLSSKTAPDPAVNSPVLNADVPSSFSKATTPKEALLSICAAEYALFQDIPNAKPSENMLATKKDSCPSNPRSNLKAAVYALFQDNPPTKPMENNLAQQKDSCPANPRNNLKVKCRSPKAVAKDTPNVIHNKSTIKIPSKTISEIPSNSPNSVYYYDHNLDKKKFDKSSIRTYSKTNKNSLQPQVKTNTSSTCSVAVSQMKQTTVMNPMHSSHNTSEVKMYKMNISPIVKYKETRG